MGEETTKTSLLTIEQCHYLRQIWSSLSHVLVFAGCAPDLFRELSIVSGTLESDNASIDSIRKNLSELFADTSIARVNRFELSCFAAIISKAFSRNATSQQNIDTAKSDVDYFYNTDLSASRDGSQSTNIYDSRTSLLNTEDEANTSKVSDPSESEDDIDDLFGIPPCLVSEGANLSQYRDKSLLSQTSKHTMAMEQPISSARIDPAGDTTLAHGGPPQSLPSRQASIPTLTTLFPNTPFPQPFITAACSNDTTSQYTGYLTTGQSLDASAYQKPPGFQTPRQRQRVQRNRSTPYSIQRNKGKGQLNIEIGISAISSDILNKIQRIAGPEVLSILWQYLRIKRTSSLWGDRGGNPPSADHQDSSIEGFLLRYQLQYERGTTSLANEHGQFAEVPQRLYLANVTTLYTQAREAQREASQLRKRQKSNKDNNHKPTNRSINDIFVNFLFPQLQEEGKTRIDAKRRFENWRQLGRMCAKLVGFFGIGILLLIPQDLSNENLRALTIPEEDSLIKYLDRAKPFLKADIQLLSMFLSRLIEGQGLPDRKLNLETWSEYEVRSREYTSRPLKEILEYSNEEDYMSFLIDQETSQLSLPDTEPSAQSFADSEGDSNIALLGQFDLPNLSITSYTDFIGDGKEMDTVGEILDFT